MEGGGRRERDAGLDAGSLRSPCEQSTSRYKASAATPGRECGAHKKASRRGRGNPVRHQSILEYALIAVPRRPGARRAPPERSTSGTSPPQALRRHQAGNTRARWALLHRLLCGSACATPLPSRRARSSAGCRPKSTRDRAPGGGHAAHGIRAGVEPAHARLRADGRHGRERILRRLHLSLGSGADDDTAARRRSTR